MPQKEIIKLLIKSKEWNGFMPQKGVQTNVSVMLYHQFSFLIKLNLMVTVKVIKSLNL